MLHVYYALSVDYFLQFSVQRLCLRRTNDEIRRHQEISLGMVRDQNDLGFIQCRSSPLNVPVFYAAWTLNNPGFLYLKHQLTN